jgi:hypothetical protein
MYSSTSVTLSPTWRSSVPPQALHTLAGACTMSRRGSSGGSWRRFFLSVSAELAVTGGTSCASGWFVDVGAVVSAFAASISSSANSNCSMARSMRSEFAPNFSRRSLASWAFSFSASSVFSISPFLAAASSAARSASSASLAISCRPSSSISTR